MAIEGIAPRWKADMNVDEDMLGIYPDTGRMEFPYATINPILKREVKVKVAALMSAAPDLLTACIWAEAALAPFSKDPAEKSGIKMLRAAIARAKDTP